MSDAMTPPTYSAALAYCGRGWSPVRVELREKRPRGVHWQETEISQQNAKSYFATPSNIGIVLGPRSGNLVDVDLDCAEAVQLAPRFLPSTGSRFGRPSKPLSHWLYRSDLAETAGIAAVQFRDPTRSDDTGMILELRCGGGGKAAQTVFPPSIHPSGEPIAWAEDDQPAEIAGADLRRAAGELAAAALLRRHWPGEGSRHIAQLALSGFLTRHGWPADRVAHFLAAVADEPRKREQTARDSATAERTFGFPKLAELVGEQVAKRAAEWLGIEAEKPEAEAPRILGRSAALIRADEIPPRAWHVQAMIPGNTVTLFSGDGGTGKSLVAMQLAAATALGRPWLGRGVQPGRALYLSAEDDDNELDRRIAAIAASEGVPVAALGGLVVHSLAGKDALLATSQRDGTLTPTTLFRDLDHTMAEQRPALVVLDTLADLFPGNENDRAQARQFVGMLRGLAIRHGCAVVLLSHPSLTGLDSGTGTSGSTAWNNSVRSRLYLERVVVDKYEADPDARILSTKKSNYGRAGSEIALRWESGVFVAPAPETVGEIVDRTAKAERVFLKLLRQVSEQGRYVNASGGEAYAPTMFAQHPEAEGVTKRAFRNAMDALMSAGRVVLIETGPPSRRRSHLAEATETEPETAEPEAETEQKEVEE